MDGLKTRNHFTNLEWTTPKENLDHSKTFLGNHHGSSPGEASHSSKLKDADVQRTYQQYRDGVPLAEIARQAGIRRESAAAIISGVTWKHLHALYGPTAEERTRNKKLTKRKVMQIHTVRTEIGESQKELARVYGVSPGNISMVLTGKTWNDVFREFHGLEQQAA